MAEYKKHAGSASSQADFELSVQVRSMLALAAVCINLVLYDSSCCSITHDLSSSRLPPDSEVSCAIAVSVHNSCAPVI